MSEEKITLNVYKRDRLGKRVKQLRAKGHVPAVLYGPTQEPIHLQAEVREITRALAEAGGSQLINLHLDGDDLPALVRDVQRDSLHDSLVHVDFYAVSMDRAIRTEIPLEFHGEPALVEAREAILFTGLTSIEIETLPGDLPPLIDVDLTVLEDMDDVILVSDLPIPEAVTVITDADELVATLSYMEEEIEEEVEEEDLLFDVEEVEVIGKGKAEEDEEFLDEEEV